MATAWAYAPAVTVWGTQMLWLRIVGAALLVLGATLLTVSPSQAQTAKPGQSGTGGAAGVTMEPPDMSRGMGAPNPNYEAPPPAPPGADERSTC